jgi:hypothetical protein
VSPSAVPANLGLEASPAPILGESLKFQESGNNPYPPPGRVRRMAWAWTLLLAALLAAPLAQAQAAQPGIRNPEVSTPTALYFHLPGVAMDFPINTQQPQDLDLMGASYGLAAASLGCAPSSTPLDGVAHRGVSTYYGYSTAGPVEYGFTENGAPRVHPERQLAADVRLDPAAPLTVTWYTTTFAGLPSSGSFSADPVLPNVVARATLRTGEAVGAGDGGYDSGAILAQGQTLPTTLLAGQAALGPDGQPNPQVSITRQGAGEPTVYGFAIPLELASATLPKDGGFSLRVDLFMSLPGCDGAAPAGGTMPNAVQPFSDAAHRPRLELSVLNPLRVDSLRPEFVDDLVVVHAAASSPWGSYDVDAAGMTLDVAGPRGQMARLDPVATVQRTHEEGHHAEPVDATYVWPYRALGAPDGTYTFTFRARNLQGTAAATAVAATLVDTPRPPSACIDSCAAPPAGRAQRTLVAPVSGVVPLAAALLGLAARRRGPANGRNPLG